MTKKLAKITFLRLIYFQTFHLTSLQSIIIENKITPKVILSFYHSQLELRNFFMPDSNTVFPHLSRLMRSRPHCDK